jgi:hypothetical protein
VLSDFGLKVFDITRRRFYAAGLSMIKVSGNDHTSTT